MADISGSAPTSFTIWWPAWIYESMPILYGVAGVATILLSDTAAGYGVGALLLLAALLILKMRMDYRHFNETIRLAKYLMENDQEQSD